MVAAHAMLFWFSVPPCSGTGFARIILCAHPYWILVPAFLACGLSTAAVLLPREWGGGRVVTVALGSVLFVFGLLQVLLRHEHGNLAAGSLMIAIGGVAVAATMLVKASRDAVTRTE